MFDTEKFIAAVKQRPALYDAACKEYTNREMKAKRWNEVGQLMYPEWDNLPTKEKHIKGKELIKKWKAIRDNFVKDYRKMNQAKDGQSALKKRPYIYYEQLLFLIPSVRAATQTPTVSSAAPVCKDDDPEENKVEVTVNEVESEDGGDTSEDGMDTPVAESTPKKRRSTMSMGPIKKKGTPSTLLRITSVLTDIVSQNIELQNERALDRYGNKAFLMSFAPVMDSLPPHLFLNARLKISQVFQELLSAENYLADNFSMDTT